MYKVTWDKSLNGILLVNSEGDSESILPPRPVFFEELDLLGFNRFWYYPKVQDPLLWAIGRRYYYKGELVAEAKGGNIFESPEIVLTEKGQSLRLEPIYIKEVIEKNKEALFVLENEALDFIEHTYKVYKKKGYSFAVSYSGGKDSQVILDLVTRVISPDDLVVIFSDTTMEISYTYENVEKTKQEYEKRYPGLKFYIAKPLKPAIEFWKEFGPPSRIHRWCCSVIKTVPFVRTIKAIFEETVNENGKTKLVVFDGVRSDESVQRGKYQRLSIGKKHSLVVNAEVIRYWNTAEVFLYIFYRNLLLNKGYIYGLSRVGCTICPFNSSWSEFIIHNIQRDIFNPFIDILNNFVNNLGIKSSKDIYEYIIQGQWKKRAGGEGIDTNKRHLELTEENGKIIGIIKKPNENLFEWVKTVGDIIYKKKRGDIIYGEIKIKDKIYDFTLIKKQHEKEIIEIKVGNDKTSEGKIKRVLYKTTYCVHCGACEVECPTGALEVIPKVKINNKLCTHCGNCLDIAERGCLVAKSLQMAEGRRNMNRNNKIKGFGRYLTFGLREEWLQDFMGAPNNWFKNNNLGNKQLESMKAWLLDANFIDNKKQLTPLTQILSKIYTKHKNFVWQIIWSNLYYGSTVCRIYVDYIGWNSYNSVRDLNKIVANIDNSLSERTIKSGVSSLFNMFEKSPLGRDLRISVVEKKGRERYVKKIGTDDIHPLAIAYSLYKAAECISRRDFMVSELYSKEFKGGPYKLFGISREKLERVLRGLQEDKEQILRVDLVADLDNIYLRNDLSSLDIVKIAGASLK